MFTPGLVTGSALDADDDLNTAHGCKRNRRGGICVGRAGAGFNKGSRSDDYEEVLKN